MLRILGGLAALALAACAAQYGPYDHAYQYLYGQKVVVYGDGRHPGAVFNVRVGTPVIAAADGEVISVRSNPYGGYYVGIAHNADLSSWYGHLDSVHAHFGQVVKRGDFLGFSGEDYRRVQYLHFRLCQQRIFCNDFPFSVDPAKHWLGGKLQCFQRGADYSRAPVTEMTVPLACGEYAVELVKRASK
jgi:hypothetical protein